MAERVDSDSKPEIKLVAEAQEMPDGRWAGVFAVPGMVRDFVRDRDGNINFYDKEIAAQFAALRVAVNVFNAPINNRKRKSNRRLDGTRPAKMTGGELSAAMTRVSLTPDDLAFLIDKPPRRIHNWLNSPASEADVQHEIRILLALMERYGDEAVDLAFDVTNDAIDEAESKGP